MAKKTNDGSLQSTKQMLDELDALMEQMMALPVNEPDAVPPFPKSVVKGPNLAATLTLLNPPPEPKAPAPEAKASPPVPAKPVAPVEPQLPKPKTTGPSVAAAPVAAAPPPKAKPEQWKQHPVLNPPHLFRPTSESSLESEAEQPKPLTNMVLPPSALAQIEPLLAEFPDTATPLATRLFYAPLVWLNELFDAVTSIFWGTGWMRIAGGRMFLGVSGIVLMLIALAWALMDWRGWNW